VTARGPLVSLTLAFLLTGCPPKGTGGTGTATVDSGVPMTGRIKKPAGTATIVPPPPAPAEEGAFKKETLFEVYRAEMLGDKSQQLAVETKYGLVDAQGKEVPERMAAYEDALKKFADAHRDEWSALADEIEAARVTSSASPGVGGK
jgi:hypothetical protein